MPTESQVGAIDGSSHGSAIEDYKYMENLGAHHHLEDGGEHHENATRILDLKTGDSVSPQNLELEQGKATVSGIVKTIWAIMYI